MRTQGPPRLVALARHRLEQLAFAPRVLSPEERAAEQEATLAILRERLAPETFDEVHEMVLCDDNEFERRARVRFGEEGYFTIIELILMEYPPEQPVRLTPVAGGVR